KAYGIRSTRPLDLAAQWRAFDEAVAASRGSSYAGDATTQLEKIRRKLAEEREALEARTQDAMTRDQLKAAIGLWETDLRRYDVPEWTRPAAQRLEELKAEIERRFLVARDAAAEAKRRGDEAESRSIRAKVAAWGLPGYAEQIDQALAAVVPDKPATPPEGADKATKEREAYVNRWKEMLGPIAARDYAEAVKLLEKLLGETKNDVLKRDCARDLENVKLAAAFIAEAGPLLAKVPKGQKLAWTFLDPAGAIARLDDVVLKIDATRVEVKWEEGSRVISFGEVGAATLAELEKGKAARAAAIACFLEGDPEGAKRAGGEAAASIPEYYGVLGREGAEARARDEKEIRARALFYEAERDYFDVSDMAGAVASYKTLLAELGGTAFVRRNRAAIAARTEGGLRDLLIPASELVATAGFKQGKYAKVDAAWVAQADIDVPKMKENFVEFGFPALADTEYRIWILAGGCCQEVLTFYAQGSELLGPDPTNPKEKTALEPGANAGLLVKPTAYSLKKLHSQHNGPKNPERFEWILVASMKYAQPGVKRFRILTNQKGFAVAQAAILATRPGPPRETDFKDLEKWKAETPGATFNRASQPTGSILWEVFRGIPGGGIGELVAAPIFKEDKPTEHKTIPAFEATPNIGNDYGARIRGYIHPPVSGLFVFWIATDDQGELKLSSDEDPAHAKTIASVPEWTGQREFTKFPQQQSQPIELKAGRRYYIEALQKQGVGGDHLSVGWRMANGIEEKPIPGSRLSPWVRR
ncbi:MAG TPA: PA14 domain-containing protein, partial [Planctomycetota bacterium]|nr:PA14 domain-containing protein [Planctomycetota bacterium]